MSFRVNKKLAVRQGPFDKGLDLLILSKTEELLQQELRFPVKLFSVDYKEVKSTKLGYRMFEIKEAFNQKDK